MFRAFGWEFRWRYFLHGVVYGLGFWAPWNLFLHVDPTGANAHTWGILAANLAPYFGSATGFDAAFNVLLVAAIAFALAGAGLRTWGGAYLGERVVQDERMHAVESPVPFAGGATASVLTDGPYGHLRNPLYVGTFLHTFALALLMPRSGAVFALVVIGLMQVRLIGGEEAFLQRTVGPAYEEYCRAVPRVWPALRAKVARSGRAARWGQAFVGESYFWIVAAAFCVLGWRYNAVLLMQAVLVAFGISLLVKASGARIG